MKANDLLVEGCPFFTLREFRYVCVLPGNKHSGKVYYPTGIALAEKQRTVKLILCPMRRHFGKPIYIVPGGGYDPIRDPDGTWVSHRKNAGTQHRLSAVDFRVGTSKAKEWAIDETLEWIESRLSSLSIPGGVGVYRKPHNLFIHIDLRTTKARWTDGG